MKPKMKHRTKTKIAALLCSALMLFGVLDISPAFKSKAEENMGEIPMETEKSGAGETYNFWTDPSHTGEWWVTCTNEDHPAYGVMNNQYRVICCENTKASPFSYGVGQVDAIYWTNTPYQNAMRDCFWNAYLGHDPNGPYLDTSGITNLSASLTSAYSSGGSSSAPSSSQWVITDTSTGAAAGGSYTATEVTPGVYKTPTFLVGTGTPYILAGINIPSGFTLNYSTNGGASYSTQAGGTYATLPNGAYFYFATDGNVSTSTVNIGACLSDGSAAHYIENAYVLSPSGPVTGGSGTREVQSMAYAESISPSKSFSITITQSTGCLAIRKASANPTITNRSSCYSLENAVYGVYASNSDAAARINPVTTLTTDVNGYAAADNIVCGTYYVRETTASKGFYVDETIYPVTVTVSNTTANPVVVNSNEVPRMDPVDVLLKKQNSEGTPIPDAQYTFKFYKDVLSNTVPTGTPTRTWVLKTDAEGKIRLLNNPQWFVSGDEFYYNALNIAMLPYGTLTIEETLAPEGYVIDNTVYVRKIEPGATEGLSTYNMPTVTEETLRADVEFTKVDTDGKLLKNVKFEISNGNESYIIWTDENGHYSSASAPHSHDTNGGNPDSGLWFGTEVVNDSKGALPYGTYTITEKRCEANKNTYKNAAPVTIVVTTNGVIYDAGNIVNENMPKITSKAKDKESNVNIAAANETSKCEETLYITDLDIGHEYKVKSYALRKSDNTIVSTIEKTFTADAKEKELTFDYEFTVADLKNDDIVFGAQMFDSSYPGEVVTNHFDINDDNQTIHFPDIHTTATSMSTDSHNAALDKNEKLRDVVDYTNLVPGKEYVLETTVMIKKDGKEEIVLP